MTNPPLAAWDGFNDADLRYLREALPGLRHAHRASEAAADGGSDPRVRVLACRARATRSDAISAITSLLLRAGLDEGALTDGATLTLPGGSAGAPSDPWSLGGHDPDGRFVGILTQAAGASLVSARVEMVHGFSEACRRLAEDAGRESWRELAALDDLIPGQGGSASGASG